MRAEFGLGTECAGKADLRRGRGLSANTKNDRNDCIDRIEGLQNRNEEAL
jgi:hypothetical protein